MIGRSRLLLGVVIVAVASTAPASIADAHVPDGHVISGAGTTNYGNKVSITSTDLSGAYGTANYNGTNIPLDCVDVEWWFLNLKATHSYQASGQSANGDRYYFSITSTSVSRVDIQKNTGGGPLPCGFSPREFDADPDSYEHTGMNGAFVISP